MKKIVASVKLAPGCRGYFDPLTGINLSRSNSVGYVRENDNASNIRKAIKEGKIKIVGGQLPPAVSIKPREIEQPVKVEKIKVNKVEPKKAPVFKKAEEPKEVVEPKKEEKKEVMIQSKTVQKKKEFKKEDPVKEEVKPEIKEEVKIEEPVKAEKKVGE